MNTLRRFVASVLKLKYGVRGSLKPPLGGPHAGLLYPLRYHAWKLTNRLYHWSGLPAQWHAWTLATGPACLLSGTHGRWPQIRQAVEVEP